ncbi:hypothetical protein CKAN_00569800 [Cinnamomum micranthum f. kanehirae]|uniref:Uncharacterized protein n=1 Tax=Cinnamomum micranthum f. kanehirae TaxID=337451 RepID=A0A3S3ND00_9MAGN|nr:hypothetical protein CKAN_00569800 [Cinnamomum micranthum f. kanehirae]
MGEIKSVDRKPSVGSTIAHTITNQGFLLPTEASNSSLDHLISFPLISWEPLDHKLLLYSLMPYIETVNGNQQSL